MFGEIGSFKMKKLLLILLCLPMIGFGQNFTVTPNGLRDNTNLEKTYVVIYTPGKTAEQNYNSALNYIKDIISLNITKDIEFKHISYTTNVPHLLDVNNVLSYFAFSANYTTKMIFSNDSILFEITDLDIYMKDDSKYKVVFLGSYLSMTDHAIYIGKKKSKIQQRMKQTKTDIENYFNNRISLFKDYLLESVNITRRDTLIELRLTANEYYNNAEDFRNNGKYQLAIDNYSECLKLEPNYGENNGATTYNQRGVAYFKLNNFESAISDFNTSITIYPYNEVVSQNINNATVNLERNCKKPKTLKKYNSRQSQEDFEMSEKYQIYLTKLNEWKDCRSLINNYRLYSRKMQIDKETGLVIIDNITKSEGLSKNELYSRAKVWIASNFNSSTDVIKLDDKENGIVIVKGLFNFSTTGIFGLPEDRNCFFTLKIYCKEGRFRVIWTDFKFTLTPLGPKRSYDYTFMNPYEEDGVTPNNIRVKLKEGCLRVLDNFNYSIVKSLTQKRETLVDDW